MWNTIRRDMLITICVLGACAFVLPDERAGMARREFGFALNPDLQGGLVTLFIFTVADGEVVDSRPLRPGSFILQVAGIEQSPANIEGIDLLEEYGITGCGPDASASTHDDLECPAISDLWKLRYRSAPAPYEGAGWATEQYHPSDRQQVLLQAYRQPQHADWHGPYFGANAFRLLRDLQDPAWVRLYRDGG
jgi:hypothetical protein